jgi:hypothetical protein
LNNLQDCRAQEAHCRRRAEIDEPHRDLWLSMAERWLYLGRREGAVLGDKRPLPKPTGDQAQYATRPALLDFQTRGQDK